MKLVVPDGVEPPGEPPSRGVVITPRSKFQVSLGTLVLMLIGLFEAGRFVFSAWTAVTTRVDVHIADEKRHFDEDFKKVHGEPVGKNDLDVTLVGFTKSVDDFRGQVHLEVSRALDAPRRRGQ